MVANSLPQTPYTKYRRMQPKEKTIHRAPRGEEHPYTMISARLGQDRSISFAARGLMLYILSKPDHWVIRLSDLQKEGHGRDACKKLLRELESAGYLVRDVDQSRTERGRFAERIWRVYELPLTENPSTVKPAADQPPMDEPPTENPPLDNPESSNELNQKESSEVINESSSDERDFLSDVRGEFKKFERLETQLRVQLERLGERAFKTVMDRCKKYGAKSWGYVLSALEGETTVDPSPSFADPLPGNSEPMPDDFMPDEPMFRRIAAWNDIAPGEMMPAYG